MTRTKAPEPPAAPRHNIERQLAALQRRVSQANVALRQRNALMVKMKDEGWTLRQMTAVLNHAAVAEGDSPMTEDTVQKAIRRTRDGV